MQGVLILSYGTLCEGPVDIVKVTQTLIDLAFKLLRR